MNLPQCHILWGVISLSKEGRKKMSRLIDADKLANKSCPMGKRKYCCNCGEKRTIKDPYTNQSISCDDIRFDFLQMIDREKTVKAIPIEWIRKWNIDNYPYTALLMSEIIPKMIADWEKENEVNRR